MKRLLTLISALLITSVGFAQPVISSGNPLTGINGDTYDSVASTGTNMYGSVANSKNGRLFATNNSKLRYINPVDFSVVDSMDININYFVGAQSNDTMFGLNTSGNLYRFNTNTKVLIDTVGLSGQFHIRVAERPDSKEVWISGKPMHVVNYTNAMVSTDTFAIGGGNINNLKISSDGLIVYAASGVTKRIYLVDAVAKVVTDSVDFAESPTAFELNADDSKMYVAATGKVYVVETTNYTIIDSANVTKGTTSIYRHPTRAEMWCMHHFAEAVTIFDADTYALIDSFGTGGSPFFLAFGQMESSVNEVVGNNSVIRLYPNPARNAVNIEVKDINATIQFYNITGALLKTQKVTNSRTEVSVADLPAGMYYIQVLNNDGDVHTLKFSKI